MNTPDDRNTRLVTTNLLNQAYQRPETGRPMERVAVRSDQLMELASEMDEVVCNKRPGNELREYIAVVEYIAAEIQAICARHEQERRKRT